MYAAAVRVPSLTNFVIYGVFLCHIMQATIQLSNISFSIQHTDTQSFIVSLHSKFSIWRITCLHSFSTSQGWKNGTEQHSDDVMMTVLFGGLLGIYFFTKDFLFTFPFTYFWGCVRNFFLSKKDLSRHRNQNFKVEWNSERALYLYFTLKRDSTFTFRILHFVYSTLTSHHIKYHMLSVSDARWGWGWRRRSEALVKMCLMSILKKDTRTQRWAKYVALGLLGPKSQS